ncbi:hypothetical protein F503_04064 [Ophiostoma piceae UAMH 11346]|uniref:Uncharacterized protein n=1 Tax=Ophiostoma piceae (strain UAMH 11346) TaxID=1262450 RepID=S3CQ43_OPHP1|nr:hypothetical protein F503_04064 [Ophiostoma piceae UAMH 11346]
MGQPPGQLVGNMVWLVDRYPRNPGELMRMGSILTNPENLETSLNLNRIEDPPMIIDATLGIRSSVESSLSRDSSALLKAAATVPVFSGIAAGLVVDGRWKHDVTTTVRSMDVKASAFIPDDDYMGRVLEIPTVVEYVKTGLFSKRLYIVVGVATAKKLYIRRQDTAGVLGTSGVPAENTTNVSMELEAGEKCDFAYRVRQFTYSKIRGLRSRGDYIKKAMLRADGDTDDDDDEPEYVPRFRSLEPSDAAPTELVGLVADN